MFFQDPFLLYQKPRFVPQNNMMYHGTQYGPHYTGDRVCSPSQPCFLSKPSQHNQDSCAQVLRGSTPFSYNPASVFQPTTASKPEMSDPSPEIIHSLPVYFRVKPTLRTASGRRCRKSRTVFTDLQLRVLEKTFSEQKYLDSTNRAKVAQILGLNEAQVKTWFQNRRMKWKKKTSKVEKPDSSSATTSKAKKLKSNGDSKGNETETKTKEGVTNKETSQAQP